MRLVIAAVGMLVLSACGGGGGDSSPSPVPTPTPATNTAPTITDPGDLSVREGSTAVATLSASDPENDSLTFSIESGDDQDQFSMSAAGALTFVAAPDYETALDANTDNAYLVTIQVSDGSLTDTQAFTVNVTDAFEGRVVDGPIAGATVVVDLNGNGVADDGEISGETDENGFFQVDAFSASADTQAKIIAKGGTDTATGKELPNLTLISDVPADPTFPANVTPLTTVLSALESEADKVQALAAMGITASPEDLLTTDGWAAAEDGDESAKAVQRVNQQIALLLQTASTLTEDGSNADVSLLVAETVAEQISSAAAANGTLDLTAPGFVESLLLECLTLAPPDEAVEANTLASVAASVANLNAVIADPSLDPVSETALAVVLAAQDKLQDDIVAVVAGTVGIEDFEEQVAADELFADIVIVDALDTDADGIPDALDTDDDGDGVRDGLDAFPKDPAEVLDTDLDGIGNNADTDDDGDGLADAVDSAPLVPNAASEAQGLVIDGYVSGANVFLDLNLNLLRDAGEPSATTDAGGAYALELTAAQTACLAYVPVVADVPVGAMDSDLGEVTQAYKMVLPPRFDAVDNSQLIITPLTTVVWDEINKIIEQSSIAGSSCASIAADEGLAERVSGALESAIRNTVRHYNISATSIFKDYIALNDTEASTAAADIVRGLKRSLAATSALRAQYPSADWAFVTYYKFSVQDGDSLYPQAWYRETDYKIGNFGFYDLTKVSGDLDTDIRTIVNYERDFDSIELAGGTLGIQRIRNYQSQGGDDSPYSCEDSEEVSLFTDSSEYLLTNRYSISGSASLDACQFESFASSTQSRRLQVRDFDNIGNETGSTFDFAGSISVDGETRLSDWFDFSAESEGLVAADLIGTLRSLPYQFCNTGLGGATAVYRRKVEVMADRRLTTDVFGDDSYSLYTEFNDGTSLRENLDGFTSSASNNCAVADSDLDGVNDADDAFPYNGTESVDTDLDGIGNNADTDDDGDGVADARDAFPLNALEILDSDGDGAGNNSDPDDDGDGFVDALDAFPLQAGEWLDTDGDGIGNNTDNDDDGDGVDDSNDPLPLSAANLVDTDGDGVQDFQDVLPNDGNVSKALQVDLTGVESIGLGEVIDSTAELTAARFDRNNKTLADRFLAAFSEIIAPKAYANDALSAQTNAISWDENGNIVAASILSSETLFVAEANVSPDGKYVYLLTSQHIQRAIAGLDDEVCSMYQVELADMTFRCLLTPEQGDIEPKSLIGSQATDFARRGIAFRSDGAALMQGFNRDLPEGVDGGTASTSAWFMSPDGVVTPMPLNPPYYAFGVFWLTDDQFAVAEIANTDDLEEGMSQERFVIYSADTLQRVEIVVDGVTNFGTPFVRKGTDVYWDSYVLRGDTLLIENSGGEGYPLLDPAGDRMLFLIDYIQSQRDESIANSARNRILSLDGSIELPLSEGTADWYERTKQSGTGTDIKYPPIGFSETHLAYRKTYEPAEPIQTLAGIAFDNFTTFQLTNGQGSIEIQAASDIFLLRPAVDHTGDLTIDYEVRTPAGALEARALTITGQTIANWRADGRPSSDSDYLSWASPNPQREGFCVYEFATAQQQCVNFTDYQSSAVDMEYFRETRYDDAAVYPDGSGNAFPGIQNTLLVGNELRVFFKDSSDNTYYQAQAQVADFIENGRSALTITPAVNGAGDSNIVSDAIDLVPADYLEITDALLETAADDSVTVDFGRSLSEYAALPELSLAQGGTRLQLTNEVTWSGDKRRAVLSYSRLGLDADSAVTLQVDGPIFLPNQVRRYRLVSPLTFEVAYKNAFALVQSEVQVGDYSADIDGLRVDTIELTVANGTASVDARSAPLNKANLESAISGESFVTPTVSLPLATLPSGSGAATVAMIVTDGSDGDRDSGERQISVRADMTWSGDGLRADITAPAQTVSASYKTSTGVAVNLEVENFSADVLRVATSGMQVPASLDVRIASLLQRFDALVPASLVRAGDYHVAITTDLPLVDADGNDIRQLELLISIGE